MEFVCVCVCAYVCVYVWRGVSYCSSMENRTYPTLLVKLTQTKQTYFVVLSLLVPETNDKVLFYLSKISQQI